MNLQHGELNLEPQSKLSSSDQYIYLNQFIDHDLKVPSNAAIAKEQKRAFSQASESLDKYYTKQSVADLCYKNLIELIRSTGKNSDELLFIEPSAGSGVFLTCIKEESLGFDIAPTKSRNQAIQQLDFINDNLFEQLTPKEKGKEIVFIGNPPFGRKSKLAIEFINKALEYSNIVGFIVPIQFRKWSAQKAINPEAKLVLDIELQENAFEFMGKDYKVRCCFQVWALPSFSDELNNIRIKNKPDTNHPDFEMYQYNRTEQAKKFFDFEWDFAVPRQGYLDYTKKFFSKEECDQKQQWIFFKAKNESVLQQLLSIDFPKLSKKNIGIPGFGKADVIEEYRKMMEIKNKKRRRV